MAVIPGISGDDVQTGTANDDRILASGGFDTIDGLQGFDTIDYRAAPAGISVVPTESFPPFFTSPDDALIFDGFGAFDHVIGGVEGILGSSFRDVIEGNTVDNLFFGFDGNDVLRGGSGNDRLDGGRGNDTLDAGEGSDTLLGRSGADVLIGGEGGGDTMLGGDGDDTLRASGDDPVVMRGNAGNDAMFFAGALGNPEVFGGDGNDVAVIVNDAGGNLSGGHGDDDLSLFADPARSFGAVQGGPGDDTIRVELEFGEISGGGGDDTISGVIDVGVFDGKSGNDVLTIVGGGWVPSLLGGEGDDVLINANEGFPVSLTLDGGRGNDVLRGGGAEDVFQFSLNDRGADVVENFVAGEDLLQFEDAGLQFDDFDTNDSASLEAGDEAVSSIGNDLVIDVAAVADVDFLNTVTVVDTLSVAETDTLFI